MKKIITGLFAIAAFAFNATAQTQGDADQKKSHKERNGYHKDHQGKGMYGMEKLNLSDAQKQQIKAINDDFKTRFQTLKGTDNSTVSADAKAQRKALMQERKEKIAAVLTPEQRTQFEQMRKEHGDKNKGEWKNKTKGEDGKQKRKGEDGKEKVKVKTT
jgi:Spy/CpxP family protein refolding chaperone